MDPRVKKALEQPVHTPFHNAMLAHCKQLVESSRRKMSEYYSVWDHYDDIYRGLRTADKQDKKSQEKGEPTKMVVPITKSQIDTFIAFNFAALFQREYFFELIARDAKSERTVRIGEVMLQRDLDYSNNYQLAYQFLLDVGRFGLGIFKCYWNEEYQMVEEAPQEPGLLQWIGMKFRGASARPIKIKKLKFQGNKILNISPYRFFPDTRLPLTRFQEGEFVASEDEYSYVALKGMEFDGTVAGIDHVETLSKGNMEQGRRNSRLPNIEVDEHATKRTLGASRGNAVLTEIQVKIIPSQFVIDEDGNVLGEENYPVKYLVWYINDNRVIRCEPLAYAHDQFTYAATQLTPDQHRFLNGGISEPIDQLQEVITWFINSHITSVRRVIQNQLIVDESMLNMDDLRERRPVIRLRGGASRLGIDRYVHQLQVQDVTQNHMQDAELLHKIVQIVTGVNDNALGQFHTGRRSAEEARRVGTGVASRMKTSTMIMFSSAYVPLGQQMISNLQSGLSMEVYIKVFGLPDDPMAQLQKSTDFAYFVRASKADLIGEFDFAIFDGTLPSEKFMVGETLQEFVTMLLSQPQIAAALGYDIKMLMDEWLRLSGIRNPDRFKVDPAELMKRLQMAQQSQQLNQGAQNGQPQNPNGEVARPGVGENGTHVAINGDTRITL